MGYAPYYNSTVVGDYRPSSYANTNGDWGIYNRISNGGNQQGLWRTLTSAEWTYLFRMRTGYASLRGLGKVEGNAGVIVLPDDWTLPTGLTFTAATTAAARDANAYTAEQWALMEANGAVFLPFAGYMTTVGAVTNAGTYGQYWSSTFGTTLKGTKWQFYQNNAVNTAITTNAANNNLIHGCSVRLVYVRP